MNEYVRTPYAQMPPLATPLERLDDLADWITVQQELPERDRHWMQSVWRVFEFAQRTRCMTVFCSAGYVIERNGDEWASPPDAYQANLVLVDGQPIPAAVRAQQLLELSPDEASELFHALLEADGVLDLIGRIRDGKGK